jgi:uncharacterized membrane protein YdfJ with MMPL/SSD domain
MSIKSTKIKRAILKPARKLGVVLVKDGKSDKALTEGAALAAKLYNKGELKVKQARQSASEAVEQIKAKIHKATAPKPDSQD